jgi:hypothetical protein
MQSDYISHTNIATCLFKGNRRDKVELTKYLSQVAIRLGFSTLKSETVMNSINLRLKVIANCTDPIACWQRKFQGQTDELVDCLNLTTSWNGEFQGHCDESVALYYVVEVTSAWTLLVLLAPCATANSVFWEARLPRSLCCLLDIWQYSRELITM